MAEVSEGFPERKRGRPPKYPWAEWLDGQSRRLTKTDDFPDVKDAPTFRAMAYNAGKRMNPPVRVRALVVNNNTVEIQARTP